MSATMSNRSSGSCCPDGSADSATSTRRGGALIEVALLEGPVRHQGLESFPHECGAECVFLGRTRAQLHTEFGTLLRLEYEAYQSMALRAMRDLADEAIERFELRAVRLHHASGTVPIGDASVLVQVAAPHRDRAFEGCRFLIDRLKRDVPIWKREVWTAAQTWSPASRPEAQSP